MWSEDTAIIVSSCTVNEGRTLIDKTVNVTVNGGCLESVLMGASEFSGVLDNYSVRISVVAGLSLEMRETLSWGDISCVSILPGREHDLYTHIEIDYMRGVWHGVHCSELSRVSTGGTRLYISEEMAARLSTCHWSTLDVISVGRRHMGEVMVGTVGDTVCGRVICFGGVELWFLKEVTELLDGTWLSVGGRRDGYLRLLIVLTDFVGVWLVHSVTLSFSGVWCGLLLDGLASVSEHWRAGRGDSGVVVVQSVWRGETGEEHEVIETSISGVAELFMELSRVDWAIRLIVKCVRVIIEITDVVTREVTEWMRTQCRHTHNGCRTVVRGGHGIRFLEISQEEQAEIECDEVVGVSKGSVWEGNTLSEWVYLSDECLGEIVEELYELKDSDLEQYRGRHSVYGCVHMLDERLPDSEACGSQLENGYKIDVWGDETVEGGSNLSRSRSVIWTTFDRLLRFKDVHRPAIGFLEYTLTLVDTPEERYLTSERVVKRHTMMIFIVCIDDVRLRVIIIAHGVGSNYDWISPLLAML
ncbi:hypothetical protein Tco_0004043 [Tanacetum coccineum]